MREDGIKHVRGYKKPRAIVGRPSIIAPNRLQREFTVDAANKVWVTDITYIRTRQGWLYLAVVVDLYARKVVGWSMKASLSEELALDALLMAVWCEAARPCRCAFRSRKPIGQRRLQAVLPSPQSGAEHEQAGELLGQCRRGILLQQPEEGAHPKTHLQNERSRSSRCLRLCRSVLQSNPPLQPSRRRQSRGVRKRRRVRLGLVCQTRSSPLEPAWSLRPPCPARARRPPKRYHHNTEMGVQHVRGRHKHKTSPITAAAPIAPSFASRGWPSHHASEGRNLITQGRNFASFPGLG